MATRTVEAPAHEITVELEGRLVVARCVCGAWAARTSFWQDPTTLAHVERMAVAAVHDRRAETSRRRRPR